MVLVNGKENRRVDAADRGFHYGDGVFETIAVQKGIPLFVTKHLERLSLGCGQLGIPFHDKTVLLNEIGLLAGKNTDGVVKVIVTRGPGGRGYEPPAIALPTRVVSFHEKPAYSETFHQQGVKVMLCQTPLGINPALAGIKHTNRLEQILACREWHHDEFQEGLMLDQENHIVEGTKSNLFVVTNGRLYTPKIDRCGVAGIIRSVILDSAVEQELPVEEANLSVADVVNADELFLTNSIILLWPIKRFMDKTFGVGPITRRIQGGLLKKIEMEVAQ